MRERGRRFWRLGRGSRVYLLPGRDTTRGPPNQPKETTIGIIAFIILGLIAGYIAKALVPGADPGGLIITCLVGVAGALIGGFLAGALFDADPLDEFFDISTWLTAIVGAVILLWIYRAIAGSGSRRRRLV